MSLYRLTYADFSSTKKDDIFLCLDDPRHHKKNMNIPDHVKGETCRRLATCAWSRAPDWVTTADCYEVRVMTPQSSRRHVLSPHAPSWPAWALWAWVSGFQLSGSLMVNGATLYSHRASLQLQSQSYTLHSYCTRASTDGTGNCSRYVPWYCIRAEK